ncbi:MAG TPA: CHAT domain-containing protein, partial [Planctomycetota bacterium]|nr:CHAT domain-containing protein [Planctomycetota bacterium]
VALSGCETGVSDILGGDDPAGLATAFFHGGATSLLVSLWKVEDKATAELMRRFYREWIDRAEPRAKALRRAKLALLEEGWSKPAQWASFVLLGEG